MPLMYAAGHHLYSLRNFSERLKDCDHDLMMDGLPCALYVVCNWWISVILTFFLQYRRLTPLKKKYFEDIVGKGENAGYQYFLLFP